MSAPAKDIQALYYITHKSNVRDILRDGICSHAQVEARELIPTRVYDEEIVNQRRARKTP